MLKIPEFQKLELLKLRDLSNSSLNHKYYPYTRLMRINKWNFYSNPQVARKMAC